MNNIHIQSHLRFPIECLPKLAMNAALEVCQNVKAPLGLIVPSALTSMALAIQGIADVERMPGLKSPVSLWFMTIAESGERKSAVDEKFLAPIRDFEEKYIDIFATKTNYYTAEMKAWAVQEKLILKEIERHCSEELPVDDLKKRLADLICSKPQLPRKVKFLYDDATTGAIKEGLKSSWPSIALISDEGGSIFNGQSITDLSFPNRVWGGSKVSVERLTSPSFSVTDPRLMLSIMTQPGPFYRYCQKKGRELRDSGFFARFLFSYPLSTQGSRYINSPITSWEHLPIFHKRINELLLLNVDASGEPPKKFMVTFSSRALSRWTEIYNEIENCMQPGGRLQHVRDYGAKAAENIARLAAIFHIFEGNEGPIHEQTIEAAYRIVSWFINEFVLIFPPEPQISPEQFNATTLFTWIHNELLKTGQTALKRNYILQHGPNHLRNASKLSATLDILFMQGKIVESRQGKTRFIGRATMQFPQLNFQQPCPW